MFCSVSQAQPQVQVQEEEITEDDLRLIHERESSIRQLEVSLPWQLGGCAVLRHLQCVCPQDA